MKKAKPEKVHLNARTIQVMPIPDKGRTVRHDIHTRGLSIIRLPSAHWNWVWFRKAGKKAKWQTLGEYPAMDIATARMEAEKLNTRLALWKAAGFRGVNPFDQLAPITLGEVFKEYLKSLSDKRNPVQARAVRQAMWDLYLKKWRDERLGTITRQDVRKLHASISAKVSANRTIEFLRRLYNFAIETDAWAGENPAQHIKLHKEKTRDRFLFDEERERLFAAMTKEWDQDLCDFVRLSLYCGTRKTDTISMAWDDIDMTNRLWSVPQRKTTPFVLPLSNQAMEVLERRGPKPETPGKYVFPAPNGKGFRTNIRAGFARLVKAAGIEGLTIHDLRRSYAVAQVQAGSSLIIIARSLGHANVRATAIYSRVPTPALRESIQNATDKFLKDKN
jgi:integrase